MKLGPSTREAYERRLTVIYHQIRGVEKEVQSATDRLARHKSRAEALETLLQED